MQAKARRPTARKIGNECLWFMVSLQGKRERSLR
jgi:hypothetical protein